MDKFLSKVENLNAEIERTFLRIKEQSERDRPTFERLKAIVERERLEKNQQNAVPSKLKGLSESMNGRSE